jgi:hypothetical protein
MLMPVSTTSAVPAATSASTSATTSRSGTERDAPRAYGTMQYAQYASHPSSTLTIARVWKAPPTRGAIVAPVVAPGVAPRAGVSAPTPRIAATRAATAVLSASITAREPSARSPSASRVARHPVTTTTGSFGRRRARRTSLRALRSASPVTVHVLTTTTRASSSAVIVQAEPSS